MFPLPKAEDILVVSILYFVKLAFDFPFENEIYFEKSPLSIMVRLLITLKLNLNLQTKSYEIYKLTLILYLFVPQIRSNNSEIIYIANNTLGLHTCSYIIPT